MPSEDLFVNVDGSVILLYFFECLNLLFYLFLAFSQDFRSLRLLDVILTSMLVKIFHRDPLLVTLECVQLEGEKLVALKLVDKLALVHFISFFTLPKTFAIFFFINCVEDGGPVRLVENDKSSIARDLGVVKVATICRVRLALVFLDRFFTFFAHQRV